jgi:hypothetical protein
MSLSTILRRTCLSGGLTLSLMLALAANAFALSGTPIKLAEAEFNGRPSVAVDSAGTAYIAWADEAAAPYTIHYCTLPAGTSACTNTGVLTPGGGSNARIDNVQILIDGTTVVLLADVYGTGEKYEPEQEWTATDGSATFSLVDGGRSVADGNIAGDTSPIGAVVVPGTDALGYAWDEAGGPPTFDEFPFSSPPECSYKSCAGSPFSTLQPLGTEHQLGNEPGVVASQLGANAGVLGVYETLGKPGCASGTFDSAYVYASGEQSSTNNYDISPEKSDSAWKIALSPADCEVEYPAVGGGPSGFGVVEDDLTRGYTVYHPFDETNHSFDTPYVTIAPEFEENPSVSQDGLGGIYATFSSGDGGEIRLAYSSNGGASWTGPATLDPITGDSHLTSAVGSNGQGWAVWQVGESIYAQQFVASDAISPAISSPPPPPTPTSLTTEQTSGTTSGANITIPGGTVAETDQATISGANVGTATGTVTYHLYSNAACTAASEVFKSTAAVASGKATASAGITTALSTGKYYWQATYGGNASSGSTAGNDASTSSCGSEVLTVVPPATIGGSGTSTSTTVTLTITCAAACTVTVTIELPTASAARKGKKKPKPLTLATGTFTLPNGGTKKLTLHLTKTGRKIFAAHRGRLKATLLLSQKIDGHTILSTKTLKITPSSSHRVGRPQSGAGEVLRD